MERLHPWLLIGTILLMIAGGFLFPLLPPLGLGMIAGGAWASGMLQVMERQRHVARLHRELIALAAENHRIRMERLLAEEPTGDWPRAN